MTAPAVFVRLHPFAPDRVRAFRGCGSKLGHQAARQGLLAGEGLAAEQRQLAFELGRYLVVPAADDLDAQRGFE
jgi:hypothetical protein